MLTCIHKHTNKYIHTYMHIHTCTHTYKNTYRHAHIQTYLPTYLHTHTYIHRYTHAYLPTYLNTYIHTYRQTDRHTWHTYIHTHMHACMHACMHPQPKLRGVFGPWVWVFACASKKTIRSLSPKRTLTTQTWIDAKTLGLRVLTDVRMSVNMTFVRSEQQECKAVTSFLKTKFVCLGCGVQGPERKVL